MSIAKERSPVSSPATARLPSGGGTTGGCNGIYEMPPPHPTVALGDESCSSSSIGRDSDLSGPPVMSDEGESSEAEVQSRLKGPLETMSALDDSLPMRRGISKFYCGKSKSFASLGNVSSLKDLGKPEDPYTCKRKNLLAFSVISEGPYGDKRSSIEDAISKRPAKCSRLMSTSVTSSSCSSNSNGSEEEPDPACLLPVRHPTLEFMGVAPASASREKFPFSTRSLSLADVHGGTSLNSGIPSTDKAQS